MCKSGALRASIGALVMVVTVIAVVMARPHHTKRHHGRRGQRVGSAGGAPDPFLEHLARVQSFRCQEPKPRAVSVADLHRESGQESWKPGPEEVAFPPVTVLHRCDRSAGCCLQGDNFFCTPVALERIPLVFQVNRVLSLNSADRAEQGSFESRQETIYATNHTRCACLEEADMPK